MPRKPRSIVNRSRTTVFHATSRIIRPSTRLSPKHLRRLFECSHSSDKSTHPELGWQRFLASSARATPARRHTNKNLPNYDAVNAGSYKALAVDNAARNHLLRPGWLYCAVVDATRRDGGSRDVTIDVTSVVRFVRLQLVTDSRPLYCHLMQRAASWHSTARVTGCARPTTGTVVLYLTSSQYH